MTKYFALFLFSLFSISLFSDSIVDTLYSIPQLDGTIVYDIHHDTYVADTLYPNHKVGDWRDGFSWAAQYARAFFVFNLPEEVVGHNLINATVHLFQIGSVGNGDEGVYPLFNLATGDVEPPCLIEHVDLGLIMDIEEFDTPALQPAEIISTTSEQGWRSVNVLNWVNDDIENNRHYFQARLRLSLDSDMDNYTDIIQFFMGDSWQYKPYIVYEYEPVINTEENEIPDVIEIELSNYPNPFNPTTTISFELNTESTSLCQGYAGQAENTEIEIYNIKGQKIKSLPIPSSSHSPINSVTWPGTDQSGKPVASGIYFYKLNLENSPVKKMILLK